MGPRSRRFAASVVLATLAALMPATPAAADDDALLISNAGAPGRADRTVVLDSDGGGDALVGDWNGDGRDTVALRNGSLVTFLDVNGNPTTTISYGRPDDLTLAGDWNGDGRDTLAVRRGSLYFLKFTLGGGNADRVIAYGRPDDITLVGDWDGDDRDTLAVRRGRDYYLRNTLTTGIAEVVITYGRADDITLVGDWDGDGDDTLAVRRGRTYYTKNDLVGGVADSVIDYGRPDDITLVGDWDGDGDDTLAVRRTTTTTTPTPAPAPTSAPGGLSPVGQGNGWDLLASEDFGGSTLDTSLWTTCYWWHEHWWNDPGCTNEGTGETQWYSPGQVRVGGGSLALVAEKVPYTRTDGTTHPWRSGMVTTGRFNSDTTAAPGLAFTYGYVEMRARIPRGKGLWPALWLLPTSHSSRPEIDVLEVLGDTPGTARFHYHWTEQDGSRGDDGAHFVGPDLSGGWHTYALEWRPDALIWFVDGVERWRFDDPGAVPDEPMYILANLAVGGDYPGDPDGSTPSTATFLIDYIRVWQR